MPSLVYTGYFMIWSLVTCLKVFYFPPHDLPSSLLKLLLFFLMYIVLSLLKAFDIAIYANWKVIPLRTLYSLLHIAVYILWEAGFETE